MITGDYQNGAVVYGKFTTRDGSGAPATLSGSPALTIFKDDDTSGSMAGVTLTPDFASITGLNQVKVDTSADGSFYAAGHDFDVVITAGTVGGDSVVGFVVGRFSLAKATATLADGAAHGGTLGSSTATLALSQARLVSQTSDTTALTIVGNGVRSAVQLGDGNNGAEGLNILAGTDNTSAAGILIAGAGTSAAVQLGDQANGGTGLAIFSGPTGHGIVVDAGGNATGDGMRLLAGDTGRGFYIQGGSDSGAAGYFAGFGGSGATCILGDGTATASGLLVRGKGAAAAVHLEAASGSNANAIEGVGDGSGAGFSSVPDAVGFGSGGTIIRTGTAQGATPFTITLDSGASSNLHFYRGLLVLTTGGTGAGQVRTITSYDGSTKVATLDRQWKLSIPNNTTTFALLPADNPALNESLSVTTTDPQALLATGLVTAATSTTASLSASASGTDEIYDGCLLAIAAGTGAGQSRTIVRYNGSTRTATLSKPWTTNPNTSSTFNIYASTFPTLFSTQGLTQAATSTTLTFDGTASTVNDVYNGSLLTILSGTDEGDTVEITDYDGGTQTVTVDPAFAVTPDTTSSYAVIPTQSGSGAIVGTVDANVVSWQGSLPNSLLSGRVDSVATIVTDKTGYSLAGDVTVGGYATGQDPGTLVSAIDVAGQTLPNALRHIGATVAGKISGAGSGTEVFKSFDGNVAVTVTVDVDGNRTNVVYT